MPDPRRATPRTDHVLADARLQAAATRLGPVLVKHAVTGALERCRAGELGRRHARRDLGARRGEQLVDGRHV